MSQEQKPTTSQKKIYSKHNWLRWKSLMGLLTVELKVDFFFRYVKAKGNYGDWHKKTQKLTILQPTEMRAQCERRRQTVCVMWINFPSKKKKNFLRVWVLRPKQELSENEFVYNENKEINITLHSA